jgi:hypothetical protein
VREARKLRGYLEDLDHRVCSRMLCCASPAAGLSRSCERLVCLVRILDQVFDVEAMVSQEPEQEEKAKSVETAWHVSVPFCPLTSYGSSSQASQVLQCGIRCSPGAGHG